MVLEQKDTGYPESRRLSAFVCCFLAMFCYSPYLQHAFYHTTLFIGLTDKIDLSFAVSMASMVILLLASAVFWSKLRFIAHSWILMLLIAIISFIATASLYSTQLYGNIIPNIIIYCIAALYGMSLAVIGIQVIRLLCFQSLCSGFLVSSSAAISGQAISLVVFAVCLNAPYYDVMAIVGLPLTSCVLLFAVRHGLLRRPAEGLFLHKSHTGRRSRTILLSVSCLASLIAHVLLSFIYVAQPSLEYLGDAPLPLTVAFAFHMILLAAVVASVRRHASVIDYLFVPGLLLLAVIFIAYSPSLSLRIKLIPYTCCWEL